MAQYIVGIDEHQLTRANNYDKKAFMIACEFGKLKIVKWLLSSPLWKPEMINEINNRGNTPLIMACTGNTQNHKIIIEVMGFYYLDCL